MANDKPVLALDNAPQAEVETTPTETAGGLGTTPSEPRDLGARLATLSTLLRLMGAGLVVAATSTFMLQQWGEGNDVIRYLTLLALTAALAGAGVVCGLGVRESRGARTLLGLVLAAIPVHFAVLGGLLHSQFPWDGGAAPNAPWHVGSPATALILTGIGLAMLIPLSWVAMMAMVRAHAKWLTWAFFAANAPVLIPVREPASVAWVVAGLLALLVWLEWRLFALGYAMRTGEGRFARALIAVPVGIIVGRTFIWYEPTAFFLGSTTLSGALALFVLTPRLARHPNTVHLVQGAAAVGTLAGWLLTLSPVLGKLTLPHELVMLVDILPAAGLLVGLSFLSIGSGATYRFSAVLLAIGVSLFNLAMHWDGEHVSIAGMACLIVGVGTVAYSVVARRKLLLLLGGIGAVAGFGQLMIAAIDSEQLAHWGSLAFIGVTLIFLAALFERHSTRLLGLLKTVHGQLKEWAY